MDRPPSIWVEKDTVTLVFYRTDLREWTPENPDERVCLRINRKQFENWLESSTDMCDDGD